MANMNHTPTPYTIEADTDPITITGREGMEVIADCGSSKIPSNQRNAAFIVRACNAHDELVATLERVEGILSVILSVDTSTRLGIYNALKLARGE